MMKLTSLYSGSSGNAIYITDEQTHILVDAGLSGKKIEKALSCAGGDIRSIQAILISHEHTDHILGAGVLARRFGIPLYANEKTWEAMTPYLNKLPDGCMCTFVTGREFNIGNIGIRSFTIPHDASEPVGFNLMDGKKKVTVATDLGHMNETLMKHLTGSDTILLESNHDIEMLKAGRYPWPLKQRILGDAGHLCNEMAAEVVACLAAEGTQKFLLGHLSQENNFPELAFQTVKNALGEKAIIAGRDVYLGVALRNRASEVIAV